MSNPKLEKMMRLLCEIDAKPRSSVELARDMQLTEINVARLIAALRAVDCKLTVHGATSTSRYELDDWGVFDPDGVKNFLGVK